MFLRYVLWSSRLSEREGGERGGVHSPVSSVIAVQTSDQYWIIMLDMRYFQSSLSTVSACVNPAERLSDLLGLHYKVSGL